MARLRPWLGRAVEVAVLCVLVVVVALTFVDRSTPPSSGSSGDDVRGNPTVMTTASGAALVQALEAAGWGCYLSFETPAVTRCFSAQPVGKHGEARAEFSLVGAGEDTIGRVAVRASGTTTGVDTCSWRAARRGSSARTCWADWATSWRIGWAGAAPRSSPARTSARPRGTTPR